MTSSHRRHCSARFATALVLGLAATEMEGLYGTAKVCPAGEECLSEADIIRIMASERDYQRLFELWQGWDEARMTRAAENFFVSLGMPALPDCRSAS